MKLSLTIEKDKKLIILSGGKTMGHISPLIAIYETLKDDYNFIYFGLSDSMEERLCKEKNIPFHSLDLLPFYRKKLHKNFITFKKINIAKHEIKKRLKEAEISAIITSGGYVSIPALLALKNIKCKKFLLEANAVLGLANLWLVNYVDYVLTQFDINKKYYNVGYPAFIDLNPSIDLSFFYIKKPLVLFVGGSNGALEIVKFGYEFHLKNKEYNCIILTGDRYYELYDFNNNAVKMKRISNLSSIFRYIDIVVSRAGGATISELLLTNSKAVLIPSRTLSNDHQYKNAMKINCPNFFIAASYQEMEEGIKKLINKEKHVNKKNCSIDFIKEKINV